MRGERIHDVLHKELALYRELCFDELVSLVGHSTSRLVSADDGNVYIVYIVDISIRRRNTERGDIRIDGTAAVADCGPLQRVDESVVVSPPR